MADTKDMEGDQGDGTYGDVKQDSWRVHTPEGTPDLVRLDLNPRVSLISCLIIWGFIFWCMFYDDANVEMAEAKTWVTDNFTWFYIGSQDVWALFMIVLYFSKYGNLKLGKPDEEPEYPTVTWFSMLFACGTGVGLIYYGVSEPIWHYTSGNRYVNDPYRPDNLVAQDAINLTFYHWGIHGWVCYSLIGCLMGVMCYRFDLPMKMSACFYPLLGNKVFGWIGDTIDILSIICTLFGVCTSLGLGVIQLNAGLNILNDDIPIETWVKVVIIWVITVIATASTLSGVGVGIRRLSEMSLMLGLFIMSVVGLLNSPVYLLNVFVQSVGYYINYVIYLGFYCDAFAMDTPSAMGTERGRALDTGTDAPSEWMDGWTIFYWGWWIAWSPFVGIFIAKISRGRTIREFINGTMTAPIMYTFVWFALYGGAAIRMERQAAQVGLCCSQNFDLTTNAVALAADTSPIEMSDFPMFCNDTDEYVPDACNVCDEVILNMTVDMGMTVSQAFSWISTNDHPWRAGDKSLVRLSCADSEVEMWFFLMESHGDLGQFLDVVSMITIILYFVTSSDSGSYIIDTLASNGDQDPPRLQRLFWALTEGGAATALIVAGGSDALGALQTVSIVCGLPYTVILCFVCLALWRACQVAFKDLNAHAEDFSIGYFDFATEFKLSIIGEWCLAWVLGPYWAAEAAVKSWKMKSFMKFLFAGLAYLFLFLFVLFHFLHLALDEFWALGWTFFFAFAGIMGALRTGVRGGKGYQGNPVEDFFAALFLYPSVGQQLRHAQDEVSALSGTPPPPYLNGQKTQKDLV